MPSHADLVTESLAAATKAEFEQRIEAQSGALTDDSIAGRLENPTYAIGLELEAYATDTDHRLTPIPKAVFGEYCDKELGVHNAELQTTPTAFDDAGVRSQADQLATHYRHTRDMSVRHDVRIVLDGMWTIPPPGGTRQYLSATQERNGVVIATHMTPSPRYYAIDNELLDQAAGSIHIEVPGVTQSFASILVESLTSSIQPHVQIPTVEDFPHYHNLAIRTLGPVLALATNSPLLPTDLYEIDDPYTLLDTTHHELRIDVFEQSINHDWDKVRFPIDIDQPTDVIDELVTDPTCAPFLREWLEDTPNRDAFADQYWELDHKRGTYWRWVRAVIGGQPVGGGDEWSMRLEYRPLPTQPTITDNVGFQCLVAGLLRGLALTDHPLADLPHADAKSCFYDAVESGLAADLAWITRTGERTTENDTIYEELFSLARHGLREQGVSTDQIDRYLGPIESRWANRLTPSQWKLDRVRHNLNDELPFTTAVHEMQALYNQLSATNQPLATWPTS